MTWLRCHQACCRDKLAIDPARGCFRTPASATTYPETLGLPQVTAEHLRMLREAATFMAPSKVELDGHMPVVLRYIAKLTINPAIAHGLAHEIGSISWRTSCCGGRSISGPNRSSCSRPGSSPSV
ncbi:hypothetical protein ABZ297_41820 [Nonomuraea sp. NPDC005983]|uniref:hypothetical protein n=1 Tax=Nonomuraea sp. NPDC005983 TaxID=3155595 RepID=UPI0033AAA85A